MSSRIPFYALIQTHPSEHHSADEQGNDPTMLHPQPSPSLSEDSPQRRFRYLSELTVSEERSSEKCTHSADGEPTQAHYPLPTGPPPPYHPSQIPHPAPQPSSTTLPTSHASTSLAPSFSRQPSSSVPYPPFPLMCLTAKGKHLDKGFPVVPPSTTITPHPFATHDVNEDDWHR
jgi:hypothetical protein